MAASPLWAYQVGEQADLSAVIKEVKPGTKLFLVDFWASWCAPCRHSFVWMNQMQERYGSKGLAIVAVNVDKEKAAADKFLVRSPAQFAIAYDPLASLAKQFKVSTMPSSYMLTPEGKVIAITRGFNESEGQASEALIKKYLP